MLSYTRQKKGAGRKLTRPDCIMGRREGTPGEAAFLRKAPPPDPLPESACCLHAMRRSVRLDVPPVRLRLASWPCAKIHRRTGAFFSAIARPHPESACSTQAAPAHPSHQPCNLHITRPHPRKVPRKSGFLSERGVQGGGPFPFSKGKGPPPCHTPKKEVSHMSR